MTNSCPLCKREFFRIMKQSAAGLLIEEVVIQPKALDLELLLAEPEVNLDNGTAMFMAADEFCYACEQTDRQDDMLVCDHCLQKCCHITCLQPELTDIPIEPWYCDFCVRDHGIRQILPTANLFRRQQQEVRRPRHRLRRAVQPAFRAERTIAARSRVQSSIARSNRSRSNASITSRNDGDRSRRNQQTAAQSRVMSRPRTEIERPSESGSPEPCTRDQNAVRFVFNRDFQHVERNRRHARSRNRPDSPRATNTNPGTLLRNNTNPTQTNSSRLQFGRRADSETNFSQITFQRQDLEAFADEFRERQVSEDQGASVHQPSEDDEVPATENYF